MIAEILRDLFTVNKHFVIIMCCGYKVVSGTTVHVKYSNVKPHFSYSD